jgi:hypothetical protein
MSPWDPIDGDWNDTEVRQQVDARIAELIGWNIRPGDRGQIWWDLKKDAWTFYYVRNGLKTQGDPWSPSERLDHAVHAASVLADDRRLAFELTRSSDRQWTMRFEMRGNAGAQASDRNPLRAMCTAILRLGQQADPETLFRR